MHINQLEPTALKIIKATRHDYQHACLLLKQSLDAIDDNSTILNNFGLLFYQNVEYDLAKRVFDFAIKKDPKNYSLYNNLGLTLNRLGLGKIAVKHYKKALEIKPDYHQARSNLAYTLLYFGTTGRREILSAHKNIEKHVFHQSRNYLLNRQGVDKHLYNKTRKLRIAYVSADLRNHAVGSFMQGILKHHDKDRFDVHILDNRSNNDDELAKRLRTLQKQWYNIANMPTDSVCRLITKLQIDILIDLSGHTKGGRPDVFSQRIAPIQITYLGYPSTTGLSEIDFRIGDQFSDPPENDAQNTENLLRLNHSMWNYSPWNDMPKYPSANPFEQHGVITFGSANNHAKLQESWLKVWSTVLKEVPNSHFRIKSRALKSPIARQQLLTFFQNNGVKQDRIDIEHYSATKHEHWQALSRFDIALDSFPYNGTTTTCDLLNLGIPVVTRSGNSHVSRTTGSILNTLGLSSWIAKTDSEFIETCVEKAQNHHELKKLRQSLRRRFSSSSLGNAPLFLIEYEMNLINTWHNWCEQKQ